MRVVTSILGLLLTGLRLDLSCASGTFEDDLGVKHTFVKDKPKVVAWSTLAISLYHLGRLFGAAKAELTDKKSN